MSELRVRDHSQPCEHPLDPESMYDGAYFDDECEYWRCGFGPCPGGKEIVLRLVDSIGQHGTTLKIVSPRMWVEVVEE